jgi:glycosyltransferase involved in cell wall biosynthesis
VRLGQCLAAPLYSCVVVRRELLLFNDYGDLFLERLLLTLNPNVVLDFDDDIGAAKREPRPISRIGRVLRESPSKFAECLGLYPAFIAGSSYLEQLAHDARTTDAPADIVVIPTAVSYENEAPKVYASNDEPITFGWIGTDANLPQLEIAVPALEELSREVPLRLLVISGSGLQVTTTYPVDNRRWSLDTQLDDLREVDVGLMPLFNTRAERGKCGFKLIQYMGLGIVGVASAITTNCEIVTDGVDAFLVDPDGDWVEALRRVVARRADFAAIGAAARETVQRRYSVDAHAASYVAFFERRAAAQPLGR